MSATVRYQEGVARRCVAGLPWRANFARKDETTEGKLPQPWIAKTHVSPEARVFIHAASPELMTELVEAIEPILADWRDE